MASIHLPHSNVLFDTLQYTRRLREAGMDQTEAEKMSDAMKEILTEFTESKNLATVDDMRKMEKRLQVFIVKCVTVPLGIAIALQGIFHYLN